MRRKTQQTNQHTLSRTVNTYTTKIFIVFIYMCVCVCVCVWTCGWVWVRPYVFTHLLHNVQDATKGKFLSSLNLEFSFSKTGYSSIYS